MMNESVSDRILRQRHHHVSGCAELQPLVTAVLVCWNHERFVRAAVLSAVQQSYKNIQLIVFDNGSSDNSRRELERLRGEFDFDLVFQENIGLVRTLNKGLSMARGDFFAVLSTDDIWLPEKTEKQVRYFLDNPDVDLTFGATETIDIEGQLLPDAKRKNIYRGEVHFENLMAYSGSTSGPTVMCRTSVLRSVGGYDEDLRIEDASLVYKLTRSGFKVVGLEDTLTLYRRHGGNWTAVQPIWPDVCAIGRKYCRSDEEYKTFVRRCMKLEFRRLAGKNRREALSLLRTQPIEWTWNDVGVGILKMALPRALLERFRVKGQE